MAKAGRRFAGAWKLAPGSRATLVLRPSHLGAARRLRRLLHSSGELWPVFRQPAFLPNPQPAHYMYRGYPVSRDGGYSFMIVDPWPEDWRKTGTPPMTCTSITTATTLTTVAILKKGLRSRSFCS